MKCFKENSICWYPDQRRHTHVHAEQRIEAVQWVRKAHRAASEPLVKIFPLPPGLTSELARPGSVASRSCCACERCRRK